MEEEHPPLFDKVMRSQSLAAPGASREDGYSDLELRARQTWPGGHDYRPETCPEACRRENFIATEEEEVGIHPSRAFLNNTGMPLLSANDSSRAYTHTWMAGESVHQCWPSLAIATPPPAPVGW